MQADFSFCCCHGMAVGLMMTGVAYRFYKGFKNSRCKSPGACFQQTFCQPLESGEGLVTGLEHQEESPSCDISGLSQL